MFDNIEVGEGEDEDEDRKALLIMISLVVIYQKWKLHKNEEDERSKFEEDQIGRAHV